MTRRDTIVPAGASKGGGGKPPSAREEQVRDLLAFGLAGERFGLPLSSVREILKMPAITEVPRSRDYILGILSVRGRITTVIDLRRRLRMTPTAPTKQSRILLVDSGDEVIGLLVDEVFQVYRLHDEEVELAASVAGDLSEYVYGVGRPSGSEAEEVDDILILLDPEPLLRR